MTPLHFAVEASSIPALKALLEAGTDVTVCDELGRTPFYLAMDRFRLYNKISQDKLIIQDQDDRCEIACMLLRAGADPDLENESTGYTAADIYYSLWTIQSILPSKRKILEEIRKARRRVYIAKQRHTWR